MKAIKSMFKYIKKHPLLWIIGLGVPSLANLVLNLGFAYGMENYTEEIIKSDAAMSKVFWIMLIVMGILTAASLVEDFTRYIFNLFITKTENNIKQDLFSKLVTGKYIDIGKMDRGEILTRYNSDAGTVTNLISWDIFAVLFPIVLGVGYLVSVFIVNIIIGFIMLTLAGIVILLNLLFVKHYVRLQKKSLSASEGFIQLIDSAVQGKMSIRQMSAGKLLLERINEKTAYMYDVENGIINLNIKRILSLEFFTAVCTNLIAPFACVLAALKLVTLPEVIMIAQICRYFIGSTSNFGVSLTSFASHAVSYNRLQKVFNMDSESINEGEKLVYDNKNELVRFNKVNISYGDTNILTDVTLSVKSGEIVALVGASGSGKSSIIKALLRLIEYTGEIYIHGIETSNMPLYQLRENISYISEHSELFNATVYENISYGNFNADEANIEQALHKAAFDNEMEILQREAGENGNKLSGGQRQRVAIARGLLKDAPFIIFDEPTASLDTVSENKFIDTLIELKNQGKGIIVITHRESTMKAADTVMLIKDKKIISDFSNEETMEVFMQIKK